MHDEYTLFLGESGTHGYVEAIPCMYQFLCRAVVLIDNGNPFSVSYVVNRTIDITFLANIRGSLAIVSLVAFLVFLFID